MCLCVCAFVSACVCAACLHVRARACPFACVDAVCVHAWLCAFVCVTFKIGDRSNYDHR